MSRVRADQVPLLDRMVADLRRHGTLSKRTAVSMWAAYGAHAAGTAWALVRRPGPPVSAMADRTIAVAGSAVAGGGLVVAAAGMGRFAGVGELAGTEVQTLTTSGIYRFTRNPQYLGYVVFLGGLSIARRSVLGLVSTAFVAAVYDTWIRAEEEHLLEIHGQPYCDYLDQAPRWWHLRPKAAQTQQPTRPAERRSDG